MEKNSTPVTCEICGEVTRRKGAVNAHDIYCCDGCGFLFVHPYPTIEAVHAYYGSEYRGATQTYYPKAGSRKRRCFVRSLRFFRYAHVGKKIIDLGCGGGFMADAFRRMGADSHGLDISENSIAYARHNFPNCTFFCETFAEMARRDITFDFIFTSELMEHISGTADVMEMMRAISKPGSIVYVATPDSGHESVPSNVLDWTDVCPPEHLQWFDQGNMTRLFQNHGFDFLKANRKRTPALSMLFVRK